MDFEEFEGYKKIKNDKHLKCEEIYSILKEYEENIGKLIYNLNLEDSSIIIEVEGKYDIEITLDEDFIIIQRKKEEGQMYENESDIGEAKGTQLARVDRIIEQLYDALNDYMPDGIITEHITKAVEVYRLTQLEEKLILGAIPSGIKFSVTDDQTNKELYKINQNLLTNMYSIIDLESKREIATVKYDRNNWDKYVITRPPFENTTVSKDISSVKTVFKGKIATKDLKISVDYSENHYLIEVNEIVVGAIDCLDPEIKKEYRLEINDLEYKYLVIATAIISDIYNFKNNRGV